MNTSQNIAKAYDALELAHRALRDELEVLRANPATTSDEITRVMNVLDTTANALDSTSWLVA